MKALRVLVVEDDSMLGMLLTEMLESIGHNVCGVEPTEDEAVSAAAQSQPDLIIADARLREGSGVNAVERICRSGYVPHVFVSGDVSDLERGLKNAVIMQKPYREADLVQWSGQCRCFRKTVQRAPRKPCNGFLAD